MTGDKYDDMSTADLLREVCRKLDRIEKRDLQARVTNDHRSTQERLAMLRVSRSL